MSIKFEPLAAVMGRKKKKTTHTKVHRLVDMIDPLQDLFEFTSIHHTKMSIIYQDTTSPDADPDTSHGFELDSPESMTLTTDTSLALGMTPATGHKALSPGATPLSADSSQLFLIDADGTELGHVGAGPLAESTRQQGSRWPRPAEAQPRSSDRLLNKALEGQLMGGLNRGDSAATPTSRLTDRQKKLDAIERVGGPKGPEILYDNEIVISASLPRTEPPSSRQPCQYSKVQCAVLYCTVLHCTVLCTCSGSVYTWGKM